MITFKRYLLTLVALLAMTTGAWAAGTVYNKAVAITDLQEGDILAEGFSLTSTDEYNTIKFAEGRYTAVGTTSTSMPMVFYKGTGKNAVITGSQSSSNFTVAPKDEKGNAGNAWEVTKAESGAITVVTLAGITYDPAAVEVTYNDAKTEASFAMPAYDATVSYELVRDLTVQTQFFGIPTETVFVKKDGDKFVFADGVPTVALLDLLNENAPILDGAYYYFEKKNAETGEFEASTVDLLTDAQPGTWRIVTSATDGGPYDGTVRSAEFTLAEAYDLTLSPATDANLQSVTVAGTAKTADENGVIRGIEPAKKVKITTTGPDYIIRKATVKKAGPTIAQFTVPDAWGSVSQTSIKLSASDLDGFQAITLEQAQNIPCPDPSGEVWLIYAFDGNNLKCVAFYNGAPAGDFAQSFSHYDIHSQATNYGVKIYYTAGK